MKSRIIKWLYYPISIITHDPLWKVISLGVAIFIFVVIRQSVSHTYTLSLVVEGIATEGGEALRAFSPSIVNVTFRGTETDINDLQRAEGIDKPKLLVPIASSIHITPENITNKYDVKVVKIEPRDITAILDRKITVELPIEDPIIRGAPENGSVKLTFSPKVAKVTGSQYTLDAFIEKKIGLNMGVIDVSGHSQTYTESIKLNAPDSKGEWKIEPAVIPVEIQFVYESVDKTYLSQWVNIIQSQRENMRFEAKPAFVQVELYGRRSELNKLTADNIRVYARELDQYVSGSVIRVTPEVRLPTFCTVERVVITPAQILLVPIESKTN